MTPLTAFNELIQRIGSTCGERILISDYELQQWPIEAIDALKVAGLLKRSTPAKSAICDGCERECAMPVHVVAKHHKEDFSAFIVCDKRSDINRVPVAAARLQQWQANIHALARFVAHSLSLQFSGKQDDEDGALQIGIATGKKRTQMLCLRRDGGVVLLAGDNAIPLTEVIRFDGAHFSVDAARIQALVDISTTGDPRYTPNTVRREARKLDTEAMREQWRKKYRELKKKNPDKTDVWISQQIAKLKIAQERDSETIRKEMTK